MNRQHATAASTPAPHRSADELASFSSPLALPPSRLAALGGGLFGAGLRARA